MAHDDIGCDAVDFIDFTSILSCLPKEVNEYSIMAMAEDGLPYSVNAIRIDKESQTVWLMLQEY